MKTCPNPDCPVYTANREFPDDDTICPQCGEQLVSPELANDPTAFSPAYGGVPRQREMSSGVAFLGAIGTLLLIFVIVGLLLQMGLLHRRPIPPPASGAGTSAPTYVLGTSQPTVTPLHILSITPFATPIGGLVGTNPTAPPTLPVIPSPVGGGGTAAGNPAGGSKSVGTRLCKVISPGVLCQEVTSYRPTDTFYIAVQSTFGNGGVKSVQARLSGPPNGSPLLNQNQTITPARDGNYWVGFGFSQNTPWAPGAYKADIFVDNGNTPTTYVSWTVTP
ncbi:MAG: hypothetical protein ACR2M0_15915 [Chloroflexia bacterium]